ncbi:MAG: hypothetical protein ACREPM_05215, partial [Gemmatimonadaceae bacterium]
RSPRARWAGPRLPRIPLDHGSIPEPDPTFKTAKRRTATYASFSNQGIEGVEAPVVGFNDAARMLTR